MTDTPPPSSDQPKPETPAVKAKKKRTRLQVAGLIVGSVLAAVIVLALVAFIGGRTYLLSGPGRELVTSFVAGKKIGRYGRINVEGLSGDLFDDFTLARVTVTDRDGVWLEARNVRVDWSYLQLVFRRFHADEISADQIRLIRRPVPEPPTGEPPRPAPIGVVIDKFSANVELLENFSKEYGRWRLAGDAAIPRFGSKTANVNADSLSRPGDYLRLAATLGEEMSDLRLNLRAQEAQGGPIAGALGYSPDQPFAAHALVNGEVIDARVQTGQFTPLTVKGRFGENGGRLSGYFDFSGSDLLEPFVTRVGRTARFGFAIVPDRSDDAFQGVAWVLDAENLTSRAQGKLRKEDRSSPGGIALEVATPSLTRLAGTEIAGPTAYSGVFKGDAQTWSLSGQASLLNASLASYRATRIAGPLNVQARDGRYDIDGDIRATGGSAEGVIGALLGSQPRVQLEAARMKDGAILLERVDATGQALALNGSGSRNLLGGLSFRGRAEITDVSRIRPGARGAFGGPIQASSARTGAPWSLRFDGRGRGLVTGLGELDRVLGQQPRLQLAGMLNGGRIELNQGELTGAAGRAAARGLIEPEGRLRLALNWTAQGPFNAGPAEIAGNLRGEGAVTGTLAQPRADLTANFDRITAGALQLTDADLTLSFRKGADASDGRIVVTSGSNYGPARAAGNFFLGGNQIRLTQVDLNAGGVTAQGAVALSDNVPSSADLTFTARPGAFLQTGEAQGRVRLLDGGGADSAILDVTARNVKPAGSDIVVRNLVLNGRGTLERLPFDLALDVGGGTPVQFNGNGLYSRQGNNQSVTLSGGGRVREIAFTTRNPAVVALSGDGRVARVDLNVGGGALMGELRQDSDSAAIQADLTSVELGSLAPDLRGRATGRVSLRGAGDDLSGSANVTLDQIRSIDAPRGLAVDGQLNATLLNNVLRIQASAVDEGAVRAQADLTLPVEASAAPLRLAIARTRPLSGNVSIQGQVQPIWDLFLGGERSLSGNVNGQATIAGTLNAPRLNGRLDLADGSYFEGSTGTRLNALNLATRFDDTTAYLERFSANDGDGGTVSGEGRIGLRQGSASNLQLALNRFRIIDNDLAEARGSGTLTAARATDGKIALAGRLNVDEATISANDLPGSNGIVRMDVVEINKPGGDTDETARPASTGGPPIALNVDLTGREIFVRGRGLNLELSLAASVRGTIAQPVLDGRANVVRGDYEFAGKRFIFDDRGYVTLSTDVNRIRLNLEATREDPALTATVRVTGTAASPIIALTSTPQLPQDEILSQVLFGRSASQLSAFEAAQLAAGVASLAGGGGFDVIGNLRELAGLDRLSFGGTASAVTVAGGRYITDDVYLEIIGGGEGGAAVNVEWQVRRNLSLSSQFGGTGDTSLSIRWRRESREPGQRQDRRPNRELRR